MIKFVSANIDNFFQILISLDEIEHQYSFYLNYHVSEIKAILNFRIEIHEHIPHKCVSMIFLNKNNDEYFRLSNLLSDYYNGTSIYLTIEEVHTIENLLEASAFKFINDAKNKGLFTMSSLNLL